MAALVPVAAVLATGPVERGEEPATAVAAPPAPSVESERLYLSGTGPEAPRSWEFRIDSGRGARQWRVIPVPSNWELQGYGRYTHGKQWWRPAERAVYRTRFAVPPRFRGRRVELVFEGVMTDAEARLNGRPVAEAHRGGYTRFGWDVSAMLAYGRENLLEVRVAEASADPSVNRAEREADYWTFGGIYRPVYLEAHPATSIAHLAVDARHDGRLAVRAEVLGEEATAVRLAVESLAGEPLGEALTAPIGPDGTARVEGLVEGAAPWSAEHPVLYRLRAELVGGAGEVLHRREARIGFRTVELRAGEGLFVNDRRVLLKGVNRHSHWPRTGRAVAAAVNRRDVELIRSMNMNAVRTAHSPPDPDFLDACDELGVYVLDELPGWHDPYDTAVGSRILREMVRRDVNHPSVILWGNGNEGGWNPALDELFGEHDPQRRPVLHPGSRALGIEASHYPDWQQLRELARERGTDVRPAPVLLPTELLHALYDGGGAASLDDYWRLLRSSGRLAGAFLWSLFDEGVVRTDLDGRVDTAGNRGADGLLGPYRQPEASYRAVRELWSPVLLTAVTFSPEAVEVELENRFDETDLAECVVHWRWLVLPRLPEPVAQVGSVPGGEQTLPEAEPGARAVLSLPRPAGPEVGDAVELRAFGPDGRELIAWVLEDDTAEPFAAAWKPAAETGGPRVRVVRDGARLTARGTAGRWARFDLETGALTEIGQNEHSLPLAGGTRRADGRQPRLEAMEVESRDEAVVLRARYEGPLETATWTFHGNGRLRLDYVLRVGQEELDYVGIGFAGLEDRVRSLTWLGSGPFRVWRNRTAGGRLGLWHTAWNDSMTGVDWLYPELPGFYAGVRWASLATDAGTLAVAPDPGLFLGVLEPRFPADARTAVAEVPSGLTVLHLIPAIGTKFHQPEALGPSARRRLAAGSWSGGVWLAFSSATARAD